MGKIYFCCRFNTTDWRIYEAAKYALYQDRFELHIEVQPEIMVNKIISFILQPFVENAMYHGLEPNLEKGASGWRKRAGKIWYLKSGWRSGDTGSTNWNRIWIQCKIKRIQLTSIPEYGGHWKRTEKNNSQNHNTWKVKMEKHVSISGDWWVYCGWGNQAGLPEKLGVWSGRMCVWWDHGLKWYGKQHLIWSSQISVFQVWTDFLWLKQQRILRGYSICCDQRIWWVWICKKGITTGKRIYR